MHDQDAETPTRTTDHAIGDANARRLRIGGAACLLLAPLCLVLASSGQFSLWTATALARLGMAVMIGAVLALYSELSATAPRMALFGSALAIGGATTGVALTTALHYQSFLADALDPATALVVREALLTSNIYMFHVQLPITGLCFPLGLLLLGAGFWSRRAAPRWLAAVLMLGALLFPAGRIPQSPTLVLACDLTLLLAMGGFAVRRLRRAGAS
ncbi:MAG: hypothetical protein DWQ36_16840 [Acidobacteria bacterium]|nr:MAG: hypothetical protein DWQ30_15010 [Acidobacteriota bacterium]REK04520.1 MAG: hypothetical protein DWQ36_16840 [Acidobacteriota bacterium]